jgi:hypothetical protein
VYSPRLAERLKELPMSNKHSDYVIVSSGILALGVGLFLERAGLFLYTGYIVVGVAGTIIGFRFLLWAGRFLKSGRLALFYSAALISVSLILGAWGVGFVDSSPRKHFYLAARSIKRGESIDTVRRRMAQYESWQGQQDYESFAFHARGTSDVLIVHYDGKTGKVSDLELSLD